MLFNNPRTLLSEAAADLLDPEVSEEVKDVIEDLEDTLTNNVEEVKDADKTTNGSIPVVAESVALLESVGNYGRARYLVKLEDVIAIKETEGEKAAAEAMEEPGQAPSEEECDAAAPNSGDIIEDIANKNRVDPEQVAVVISAENARFLAQTALLEARAHKNAKKAIATKKLKKMTEAVNELKAAGVCLVKA